MRARLSFLPRGAGQNPTRALASGGTRVSRVVFGVPPKTLVVRVVVVAAPIETPHASGSGGTPEPTRETRVPPQIPARSARLRWYFASPPVPWSRRNPRTMKHRLILFTAALLTALPLRAEKIVLVAGGATDATGIPATEEQALRTKGAEYRERVEQLLSVVGLHPFFASRYPHEGHADAAEHLRGDQPSKVSFIEIRRD